MRRVVSVSEICYHEKEENQVKPTLLEGHVLVRFNICDDGLSNHSHPVVVNMMLRDIRKVRVLQSEHLVIVRPNISPSQMIS